MDAELVLIESPWKAKSIAEQVRNSAYARLCLRDSVSRGEAPFASHLLYTQIFDESVPMERLTGIELGLAWGSMAAKTIVYEDYGITQGMMIGIKRALSESRVIEYRSIQTYFKENSECLRVLADEVCDYFKITFRGFSSISRTDEFSIPRFVYFKVAKILFPALSLDQIGKVVNRDHSTVHSGIRTVSKKNHIFEAFRQYCETKNISYQ